MHVSFSPLDSWGAQRSPACTSAVMLSCDCVSCWPKQYVQTQCRAASWHKGMLQFKVRMLQLSEAAWRTSLHTLYRAIARPCERQSPQTKCHIRCAANGTEQQGSTRDLASVQDTQVGGRGPWAINSQQREGNLRSQYLQRLGVPLLGFLCILSLGMSKGVCTPWHVKRRPYTLATMWLCSQADCTWVHEADLVPLSLQIYSCVFIAYQMC